MSRIPTTIVIEGATAILTFENLEFTFRNEDTNIGYWQITIVNTLTRMIIKSMEISNEFHSSETESLEDYAWEFVMDYFRASATTAIDFEHSEIQV